MEAITKSLGNTGHISTAWKIRPIFTFIRWHSLKIQGVKEIISTIFNIFKKSRNVSSDQNEWVVALCEQMDLEFQWESQS